MLRILLKELMEELVLVLTDVEQKGTAGSHQAAVVPLVVLGQLLHG